MAESRPESDPEIADASLLFGGAPSEPTENKRPTPSTRVEGYDVEGPIEGPPSDPIPIPRPVRPSPLPADSPPRRPRPAPRAASSGVDQVWTRGAEWGANLLTLAVVLIVVGIVLYATFRLDALLVWSMLLVAGLVAVLVATYPIFITLERPVRVTPEQALKDYFNALSHHVPHFKRMWLLLANDGRTAPGFVSYPEFRAYWKRRLSDWKATSGGAGFLNPIKIEVVDFKSEKSAGQTEIEATYAVRVVHRGKPGEPPIALYSISTRLVRGSDKMWYLDAGTLPE